MFRRLGLAWIWVGLTIVSRSFIFPLSMLAFWTLPKTLEIMGMVEVTCPACRRMPNIRKWSLEQK